MWFNFEITSETKAQKRSKRLENRIQLRPHIHYVSNIRYTMHGIVNRHRKPQKNECKLKRKEINQSLQNANKKRRRGVCPRLDTALAEKRKVAVHLKAERWRVCDKSTAYLFFKFHWFFLSCPFSISFSH